MKPILYLLFLFSLQLAQAQNYPKDYFRCPLDIPISLAGNFGEMRPNHFHAGLDMRTGREGLKVHASADGYVSRIKISTSGYGKVIYITHPNGFVTVYGHLSRFNGAVQTYVHDAQYRTESFEIEVFPKPEELPVKKGDIIAFSGNTGNSGGPHVHFEIRDAKTEFPINPLLFGLNVPDTVKPRIKQLAVYPLTSASRINGSANLLKIPVSGKNGRYTPATASTLHVSGPVGFGIETSDKENNNAGENQVYSVELLLDSKRVFYYEMNTFSFDETRYVNAHLDYASMKKGAGHIQRCYLLKNNRCSIYKNVIDSGRIYIPDDQQVHRLEFVVKDINGNTSNVKLIAEGGPELTLPVPGKVMQSCRQEFKLEKDDFRIDIPANVCYEDYVFHYTRQQQTSSGSLSARYQVGDESVPLQDAITLSIPTNATRNRDTAKAVLVKGASSAEGGTWKNGWMTATVKEFGTYTVLADLVPPSLGLLEPPPYTEGPNAPFRMGKGKLFRFSVSDNLSGVKSYKALIDGKWILMEYEPKQNLLFINPDEAGVLPGEHTLEVTVEDGVKNVSVLKIKFIR
jgi:murein DD-endopeptidase MepM/ murein hydrolase activator NlpD